MKRKAKSKGFKSRKMLLKYYRKHVEEEHWAEDWLDIGVDIFKLVESRKGDRKEIRNWLSRRWYITPAK